MTELRHDHLRVRVLRKEDSLCLRSSRFAPGFRPDPQLQIEIARASTAIAAVPFPGKPETHPIRGSPRNDDRHDTASLVAASTFTDVASDLGDAAVSTTSGAGVGGSEDP
jgi:hypothetical protein